MMPDAGMGGGVIGALGLYNRGGIVPHRAAGGGIFGDLFGPDAEREAIMIARDPESSGLGAGIPYGAPDAPSPVPTGGLGPWSRVSSAACPMRRRRRVRQQAI